MRYTLLYYYNPSEASPGGTEEIQEWVDLDHQVKEAGSHVHAEGFQPRETARTLSVRDGEVSITDGPVGQDDVVAGIWVIDVPDADQAVDLAQKIPTARYGKVEIRPVVEWDE
jgi:hypothetical protein